MKKFIPAVINIALLSIILTVFFIKHENLITIFKKEINNFPTTDWVVWNYDNCVAEDILPPVKSNPYTKHSYVEQGDILTKINFNTIITCKEIEHTFISHKPGDVVAYHLKSKHKEKRLFVFLSPYPLLLFSSCSLLWSLSFWVYPIFMLLVGILVMLIYPFLKVEQTPFSILFWIGILLFFFFTIQEVRLIIFQNDYELKMTTFSIILYFTAIFALIFINAILFISFVVKNIKLNLLLSGILSVILIFFLTFRNYNYFSLLFVERSLFLIWLIQSSTFLWKNNYHKLLLGFPIIVLILFEFFFNELEHSDRFVALFLITLFYPLFANIPTLFKYGKVYLVLSRSIAIFLGAFLIGLLYFTIDQALAFFDETSKFKGLIEIFIITIITYIVYYLYNKYRDKITKIIKVGELHIYNDLLSWSENLLHYTDINKLLEDLKNLLIEKLKISEVKIISKKKDELSEIEKQIIQEIGNNTWWTKTGLSKVYFSEKVNNWLTKNNIELLYVYQINKDRYLLILLAKKELGVYNYSDIDILGSIFRRVVLALRVLYLMEREKLLEKQKIEAELSALRSQINPHFLFNTLNAISCLIHDDPDLAEEAIEELATLFRYTLQHSKQQYIPLSSELKMIKSYLKIEQIRFGDRLKVNLNIQKGIGNYLIPGLVIQTVVENAFKHGASKITGKAIVNINIYEENDMITVVVEDNGPGIDLSKIHSSTGLNNLITRMNTLFGRSDLISFQNTGNGTRVTIKFPKLEP